MSTTRFVQFKGDRFEIENGSIVVERVDGSPRSVTIYSDSRIVGKVVQSGYSWMEVQIPEPPKTEKRWRYTAVEESGVTFRAEGFESEEAAKIAAICFVSPAIEEYEIPAAD